MIGVYKVEQAAVLAEKIYQIWIRAPHVARHARAGQSVILRIDESGERIPLTISAVKGDYVRFIFMAIGKTTEQFCAHKRGKNIRDGLGPLRKPSEIAKYGTCAVVEGGV